MPKIHERESLVKSAELQLREAIVEMMKSWDLTTFETIQVFNKVMSEEIASVVKYQIRFERHGNYDTPGGWAKGE